MDVIYDPILGKMRVSDAGSGTLPPATQPGTTIAYNGAEWESRYGEKHVTATGDFLGENGYLYVLNLENDMTVRIGAVNSLEDYTFDVLVFQGAVVRQLTLLGEHHPIWWAAGDWYPQSYSSENMPPSMDEANTGYLVHCTWSSDARVLLAEVSKTFDATRGVLVDSAGVLITSAMTYTGGTIGVGEVANHVTVYNRGVANGQTVVSGGYVYVSGGGIASNTNIAHANGQMQVFVGGVAFSPTVDSGTLSVERGTVDGITANGGNVNATSNAIISGGTIGQYGGVTVTESEINGVGVGGTLTLSSGGVATSATVVSGGTVNVFSGGVASGAVVSSGGRFNLMNGGVATGLIVVSGGRIDTNPGSIINGGTFYGGNANINGDISGYVVSSGSVYIMQKGYNGSIYYRVTVMGMDTNTTVFRGGTMYVSNGGIASDTTVSSGGSAVVSSGGIASHFSSVDGATVQVLSGGSATLNSTAYGVSVESGGALTVESSGTRGIAIIQSGKTVYGVLAINGGTATASGGVMYGATVSNFGRLAAAGGGIISGANVQTNGLCTLLTAGSAVDVQVEKNGSAVTFFGGMFDRITINSGGIASTGSTSSFINSALVSSGGKLVITSANTASAPTILNGGTLTVSAGGSALDVVAEPDAVINGDVTYAQPIVSSQGVFILSGNNWVGSAMVMSGGTIGVGYEATAMMVYSRGRGIDNTIDSGVCDVFSGGYIKNTIVTGSGYLRVSSGGVADNPTNIFRTSANAGGLINNLINSGGLTYVYSGSVISGAECSSGGITISSGGIVYDAVVHAGGSMTVGSDALAANVTSMTGAHISVVTGGTITYKE